MATAEVSATAATRVASRATAHGHTAMPMKVMTKVAAMGPLAVAIPQVVDTRSRVIASARTIDIARVLVLAIPSGGGDRSAMITDDGLLISPLTDVGMTNDGGPRGNGRGYCSILAHAVYPSVGSGEDLSSGGTAPRRRRTVRLGSAHRACQARNCNERSR